MTAEKAPTAALPGGRFLPQLRLRIAGRLQQGVHSQMLRYGLRRDLAEPLETPAAKIPISVRPLREDDLDLLLPLEGAPSHAERLDVVWRRGFHAKVGHGGHVAVDERNGQPCYVQWLFGPADRELVRGLGGFRDLGPTDALLENAYTPSTHRGLGIMSAAMAMIAERAGPLGARHVWTYVGLDNPASLKGCARAGFHPRILHRRTQFGFGVIARHSFEELADDGASPRKG